MIRSENNWDQRAQGYALQVDDEFKESLQDVYLPWFESVVSEGSVLDVGCGPGFFSVLLAKAGFAVTAFDASAEMLKKARERANVMGAYIADNTFDCVCSRNLVWNLEMPQTAYREWLRVLKPGGVLLIFDGNHYRYLFDERYARIHKAWEERSDHQMLGVDARVIDDIAARLPLSGRMRPDWDVKTLSELGAQTQSTVLKTLADPKTGEILVTDFVVRAVKAG